MTDESKLSLARTDQDTMLMRFAGDWRMDRAQPPLAEVGRHMEGSPAPRRVAFDTTTLGDWDSTLLTFLIQVGDLASKRGIAVDRGGLPAGVKEILAIAEAVPEKADARLDEHEPPLVERVGDSALAAATATGDFVDFLGEVAASVGRFFRGTAQFRKRDLAMEIQKAGSDALGIVAIVAFLLGLILAFVGAVQLQQFGATIYVADLVGIAMVHDMGALMTAIVIAGRSGAAYAAQLGSMQVNQEVDALTTLGISPIDFLVLPRVLALVLMMPLLTMYADLVGILGGLMVGTGMLGLTAQVYIQETINAVSLTDLFGGLLKGTVYGALVALAGCMRGIQSSRSASGVGDAATSAVVTAIVAIIAAAGVFAVVFYAVGI